MTTHAKKYYEIGAITKVCTLIETLALKKSWELAALCRAMNMPKTTVHRMLLTLVDCGYVFQERQRGEYALSFKCFSVGSQMLAHSDLAEVARPLCKALRDIVDETVNLCITSGADILVIEKQSTRQTLRQDVVIGTSFPLFYSASGKIFLAFAEEDEVQNIFKIIRNTGNINISAEALQKLSYELEDVRKTGVAYDYEEVFQGVRCIAAPIFNHQNILVAALSISAPIARLDVVTVENININLKITARKISKQLGASFTVQ